MDDTEKLNISLSGHALSNLKDTEKNLGIPIRQAVSESFGVMNILSGQAKQGFTEVVVRNPTTHRERVLNIHLDKIPKNN